MNDEKKGITDYIFQRRSIRKYLVKGYNIKVLDDEIWIDEKVLNMIFTK